MFLNFSKSCILLPLTVKWQIQFAFKSGRTGFCINDCWSHCQNPIYSY